MTIKLELADLAPRLDEYGFAYLVTVGDSATAHVLAVWPELTPDGLVVDGVGRHSQENARARSDVTLVWPPTTDGGYTLLVDGTASVDGTTITVAPTKAILHRPAAGPDGRRAGSDCVNI